MTDCQAVVRGTANTTPDPQRTLNLLAVQDPKPGDMWHERFRPIYLIVAVLPKQVNRDSLVIFIESAKYRDDEVWNTDCLTVVTKSAFRSYVQYVQGLDSGCWAFVSRLKYLELIESIPTEKIRLAIREWTAEYQPSRWTVFKTRVGRTIAQVRLKLGTWIAGEQLHGNGK